MTTTALPTRSKRRILARVLAVAVLLYVSFALLLACTHATDRLLLHPTTHPLDTHGATRELLKLGDGSQVELFHARSPGARLAEPAAFVLFFVGNADRADRWATSTAEGWGQRPVHVTGMNYPGFGGSTGPARLAGIPRAAAATFDHLRKMAGTRPILVQGNSMGTTAALYLAAHRDVAGVSLQNPPPLREVILGSHGWWNLWLGAGPIALLVPGELDSIANARRAKAPAVFILSLHDEIVPHHNQRQVYEAYAGPKTLLEYPHGHNTEIAPKIWGEIHEAHAKLYDQVVPRQ